MPPLPHPAETQPQDAGTAAFRVAEGFKMPPVIGKRADFLAAAKARRQAMPGFLLQARHRDDAGPARIGFTCSKKVGNAVARNRAKRRLREIARLELPEHGAAGTDYVLIGRHQVTATRDFEQMRADLRAALAPK